MNRFEEQTDLLAERIAMMHSLSKHLRTGDHEHLQDVEVASLKCKIMDVLGGLHPTNIAYLDGMEVAKLQEEIASVMKEDETRDTVDGMEVAKLQEESASAMKEDETPGSYYDTLPLKWLL